MQIKLFIFIELLLNLNTMTSQLWQQLFIKPSKWGIYVVVFEKLFWCCITSEVCRVEISPNYTHIFFSDTYDKQWVFSFQRNVTKNSAVTWWRIQYKLSILKLVWKPIDWILVSMTKKDNSMSLWLVIPKEYVTFCCFYLLVETFCSW